MIQIYCRNRHCPKCQNGNAQQWLKKQQDLLLPVRYFLVTFTLPSQLRRVVRCYQKQCYDLPFRASAAARQKLAQVPRLVGGQLGMVGVLHTWGRNLSYHPHVHHLVPAGGVAKDGQTWIPARKNLPKLGEKPSTSPVVYCPSCGRVMRRRPILRPKGHCPP